ncbi:MAG: PHP domain-containing protein [Myxococcales bacterium]|jgi:hypothetical protein
MKRRRIRPLRVAFLTALGTGLVCAGLAIVTPGVAWIDVAIEEGAPDSAGITPGPVRWLKGQIHAHSWFSADSQTSPKEVLRWYSEHGFDFVVFTDHNVITVTRSAYGVLALPGVELTLGPERCEPAPLPGMYCALHMNALFVDPARKRPLLKVLTETKRLEIYSAEVEAALALGGLPVINHPNYQFAADAELIHALAMRGAMFVEIANEASGSKNDGDADHPSVEAMWDSALSRGARIWGLASDDAHDYYDADSVAAQGIVPRVGDRGFVIVRASKEAGAIRAALERGDFYSSTGLLLERVAVEDGRYLIETRDEATTSFVTDNGAVLLESTGTSASLDLARVTGSYVRARVRDANGRTAWTQPVFLGERRLAQGQRQ